MKLEHVELLSLAEHDFEHQDLVSEGGDGGGISERLSAPGHQASCGDRVRAGKERYVMTLPHQLLSEV